MPLLLYRGAGWEWGGWGTASIHIRTHNTHQWGKKKRKKKEIKKQESTALTWSPPHGSFFATAEADFAEDPQEMPIAQRAGVFARAGATLRGGDPVAVRLPRLAFLTDQGAGDRGHLPEPRLQKTRGVYSTDAAASCCQKKIK